jgi:amidase
MGFDNDIYQEALADLSRLGAIEGIDAVLNQYNLDALIIPSVGFATTPSAIAGQRHLFCELISGYPIVTVPLGTLSKNGEPFGLSFMGTVKFSKIPW